MTDYKNIELSTEMTTTTMEMLKLRGDNVSLYALKLIEELQSNITI